MQYLFWWLMIGWVVALVDVLEAMRRNRGDAEFQQSYPRRMLVVMVVGALLWPLTLLVIITVFVDDLRRRRLNKNSK